MNFTFHRKSVALALFSACFIPTSASAFSLGIRPNAGLEMITVNSLKLVDADGRAYVPADEVARSFLFFGADVVFTPIKFNNNMSVSALLGLRMASSKLTGAFVDELSFMYIPIGASFDYMLGSLRFSAYSTFDLGLSPKLKITVPATSASLEPKLASLSRIRFGAFGEYFIIPALSVFAQGDYGIGGYKSEKGEKEIDLGDTEQSKRIGFLSANDNKLKGLTFGGGVAYYFPPPNRGAVSTGSKAAPAKKPVRGTGKRPAVKPKPKPKAPPADAGSGM